MISDQAKGLFHRAIMMALCAFNKVIARTPPGNWNEKAAKHLGYEGDYSEKSLLEFFESVDDKKLGAVAMTLTTDAEKYCEGVLNAFAPVIEPYVNEKTFISEEAVIMARKAWSKDIDIIVGANSFEGSLMAMLGDKATEFMRDNESCFAPLSDLKLKPNDELAKN